MTNKHGQLIRIGRPMSTATDLIHQMLDQEYAYRFLSAVTHGHLWAVQEVGFRPVISGPTMPLASGGLDAESLRPVEKTLTFGHAGYLCNWAARNFSVPVWFKGRLFGWETSRLAPIFEHVADVVRLKEGARFWRDAS